MGETEKVEIFLDNAQSGGAQVSIVIEGINYNLKYLPAWVRDQPKKDGIKLFEGYLTEERSPRRFKEIRFKEIARSPPPWKRKWRELMFWFKIRWWKIHTPSWMKKNG